MPKLANVQRTGRVLQVLVRHGVLGVLDQWRRSGHCPDERLGRRLARALSDLGPTFVKLGQIMSTREDVIPAGVARQLARLQQQVPPVPASETRRAIERSLGKRVDSLFAHFEDRPLAAGSIAQVHVARTFEGDEVVVKVRRPGIEYVVEADLALLSATAEALSQRFEELRRNDAVGFAEEFGRSLRAELDLQCEARALVRMRRTLGGTARVPRVFEALSSTEVLTLEHIEGRPVTEVADPEKRQAAARQIVGSFATQYLRGSLFHADPHAGNLVLCPDGRLAMYDLGCVGELDASSRATLRRLSMAAARKDTAGMADAVLEMVHEPSQLDRPRYQASMGQALHELLAQPLGQVQLGPLTQKLFGIAREHRLRFRPEYFLLFRSSLLVDGVLRSLDPAIDPVVATRSYVVRSWYHPGWTLAALLLISLSVWQRCASLAQRAVATVARRVRALSWFASVPEE